MKHKKIIFVCTGNTCRSPMAEAAFRAELKKRKIAWYTVQSMGLSAKAGTPMSQNAQAALKDAGIPFSAKFTSKPLTEKAVKGAYAVVCMTESHRAALGNLPNVTSMRALTGRDVPDPYGQGVEVYSRTLAAIMAGFGEIIEKLSIKSEGS